MGSRPSLHACPHLDLGALPPYLRLLHLPASLSGPRMCLYHLHPHQRGAWFWVNPTLARRAAPFMRCGPSSIPPAHGCRAHCWRTTGFAAAAAGELDGRRVV